MIEALQIKRFLQLVIIVLCTLFLLQVRNWEAWMRARQDKSDPVHKFTGNYFWIAKGRG